MAGAATAQRLGVRAAVIGDDLVAGDVVVADGRIAAVGAAPAGRAGIALPGFVDLQVNGVAGVDLLGADADGFRRAREALAGSGVTGVLPTFVSAPVDDLLAALEVARRAAEDPAPGARILGVHLEGPFLSPRWAGAHDPAHLRPVDLALAERLVAAGPVRLMTLAPELDGALGLVAALAGRGVRVALGHSDADAATALRAFAAGARAVTHVFNAHRRWAARDPGLAGAALVHADATVMAIVDHVHLAPETAALAFRAARGRLALVTDAIAAAGLGPGPSTLGGRRVEVRDGRAELPGGVLAGSVLTMDAAVRNLVGCGATLPEAAAAAATVPAGLLGRHDVPGVLRPGAPADVAVLDEDLTVVRTLVGGAEAYRAPAP